jgi:hypothetical protein
LHERTERINRAKPTEWGLTAEGVNAITARRARRAQERRG